MRSLDSIAKTFASDISRGRSVDWYLIKLSGIITYFKDSYGSENLPKILEEFLRIDAVTKALQPLACHVDTVEKIIGEDPRFSDLRIYTNTLVSFLGMIPCKDVSLTANVREPTFRVEGELEGERDVVVESRGKRLRIKLGNLSRKSLTDMLIVISLTSVVAFFIYMILHQRGGYPSIT